MKRKAKPPAVKLDLSKCFVDWYDIDFNQRVYVCRSREYAGAIGMVWGTIHYKAKKYTHFDVYGSHVAEFLRRKGIRSLIDKTILQHFLAVTSPGATVEGRKFMKSAGYATDPLHGWKLERKMDSKCEKISKR